MRVTVWSEGVDRLESGASDVYPEGIHEALAAGLRERLGESSEIRTATLDDPEHGLSEEALVATDALVWWSHLANALVPDELTARVQARVLAGMGLVVLHSAHLSKPFVRLLGTSCNLRWGPDARQVVWTVNPAHPVAERIPAAFVIDSHETYCEYFDIPQPDELVFVSSFAGGEVFRSGCCFRRGLGRIFYFSPGHETSPVFRQPEVLQVIANAIAWSYVERSGVVPTLETSVYSPPGWFERTEA